MLILVPSADDSSKLYIVPKLKVRRVTPKECARLQGMPDWWTNDVAHSDSAAYKMWGNGMALPCMLFVMEGIAEALRNELIDTLENENG